MVILFGVPEGDEFVSGSSLTLNCSIELTETFLQWFYDANPFANYIIHSADSYPLTVEATNTTYNALVGGVDIQILAAMIEGDIGNIMTSFLSTMTVNVSALQEAGVSKIACGNSFLMNSVRLEAIIQGQYVCYKSSKAVEFKGVWEKHGH